MAKQLEDLSMTKLRAMASALGLTVSFGDSKQKVIKAINGAVDDKSPKKPVERLETTQAVQEGTSHANIRKLLEPLTERGLIISFPTSDSWHMQRDKKQDSGHMSMPLVSIVRCAEQVMR